MVDIYFSEVTFDPGTKLSNVDGRIFLLEKRVIKAKCLALVLSPLLSQPQCAVTWGTDAPP